MTNIDTQIIYDKNGNPIPQYLDINDKSGGSAGTMKPITGQNGAQFTQLTGSNVEYNKKTKFMSRVGDLPSGITETVLELRKPVLIHEFSANFEEDSTSLRLEMEVYDGENFDYYELATSPTTKGRSIIPSRAYLSSVFMRVDEQNIVKLARPLEFRGIRFKIVNVTGADKNFAVTITYSEVD